MLYHRLLALLGCLFIAGEMSGAHTPSNTPLELRNYLSLMQAIEEGDLEQLRIILLESSDDGVLKANRQEPLVAAVEQFIDSLSAGMVSGNAWWYVEVGAASIGSVAALLLGWRSWHKKKATEHTHEPDVKDTPKQKKSSSPQTHITQAAMAKKQIKTNATHATFPDDSPVAPTPSPSPSPSPDSMSAQSGDLPRARHISFSDHSESDTSGKKSSPATFTPTPPSPKNSSSDSSSEVKHVKKKGLMGKIKAWREKKKNKKEMKRKKAELKKADSSDEDERDRTAAKAGFFSSIFAKLKGKKVKKSFEMTAKKRLAIVQELLNNPLCDPLQPDQSGVSAIALVQQKFDEFSPSTWQGQLLNNLYHLLADRAAISAAL